MQNIGVWKTLQDRIFLIGIFSKIHSFQCTQLKASAQIYDHV